MAACRASPPPPPPPPPPPAPGGTTEPRSAQPAPRLSAAGSCGPRPPGAAAPPRPARPRPRALGRGEEAHGSERGARRGSGEAPARRHPPAGLSAVWPGLSRSFSSLPPGFRHRPGISAGKRRVGGAAGLGARGDEQRPRAARRRNGPRGARAGASVLPAPPSVGIRFSPWIPLCTGSWEVWAFSSIFHSPRTGTRYVLS